MTKEEGGGRGSGVGENEREGGGRGRGGVGEMEGREGWKGEETLVKEEMAISDVGVKVFLWL